MNEPCQGKARQFAGRCDRKPSVMRNGKSYCWQHDPERLQRIAGEKWERRKGHIARVETEADARIERRRLLEASGVDNLSNADLQTIIALGGVQALIARGRVEAD